MISVLYTIILITNFKLIEMCIKSSSLDSVRRIVPNSPNCTLKPSRRISLSKSVFIHYPKEIKTSAKLENPHDAEA